MHIPGGTALVGTRSAVLAVDSESPIRKIKVGDFLIDNTAVTNQRFAEFIEATGYQTDAERLGWSYVFYYHLPRDLQEDSASGAAAANWWRQMYGANWQCINGPEAGTKTLANHPAVHISHNDALAFAKWANGRLPNEAEWEHAARGGLGDVMFLSLIHI